MSARATVLVIDDEECIRGLVECVLEGAGFAVETAEDGPSGLARMAERTFDLVLCDMVLPGADGIETCREIVCGYPACPLIAMSGAGAASDALAAARRLGAVATLSKPFRIERLVETVANALQSRV